MTIEGGNIESKYEGGGGERLYVEERIGEYGTLKGLCRKLEVGTKDKIRKNHCKAIPGAVSHA